MPGFGLHPGGVVFRAGLGITLLGLATDASYKPESTCRKTRPNTSPFLLTALFSESQKAAIMTALSFRQMLGAPPSTASPSDSTLLIIDAQNEYAEGRLQVTNASESRKVIASLLNKYRGAGGKVVHIVHKTPTGAPVFTPDTRLAAEFEEIAPKNGEEVIEKLHPSSFADTKLHEYLGGKGGSKLVLTGYMVSSLILTWRAAS